MGALALAKHHYGEKRYKEAAKLFHQAYSLHPLPGFLFNAARSEQRAFQLDLAEKHYKEVLLLKDLDAKTRKRATFHLGEVVEMRKRLAEERAAGTREQRAKDEKALRKDQIRAKPKPAVAVAPAPPKAPEKTSGGATPPAVPVRATGAAWKTPAGLSAALLGVAGVAAGIYLHLSAETDIEKLESDLGQKNADGKIIGLSKEAYDKRTADIEGLQGTGWLAVGVGTVALGAGAWMLLTRSDSGAEKTALGGPRLQVGSDLRSVALTLRF